MTLIYNATGTVLLVQWTKINLVCLGLVEGENSWICECLFDNNFPFKSKWILWTQQTFFDRPSWLPLNRRYMADDSEKSNSLNNRLGDAMLQNRMSIYFNDPSQGILTNYYLILGPRDKAAHPTSQQIKTFPPKRVNNLATASSIFICISSSSTGELCSQPIRGNVRRIGHVSRTCWAKLLDSEYSFVAVRRILRTIFAKQKFAQLRTKYVRRILQLCSRTNVRPIKNGL